MILQRLPGRLRCAWPQIEHRLQTLVDRRAAQLLGSVRNCRGRRARARDTLADMGTDGSDRRAVTVNDCFDGPERHAGCVLLPEP